MILSLHHVPEDTESAAGGQHLCPVSALHMKMRTLFAVPSVPRVYLAAMPEAVLEEFAERDWELRFMTCGLETLNTSYAGGLGVTIPSGKTIAWM